MFRCDNCRSGYSVQAASSWQSCPRCLAKERINVPLSFEFGWSGSKPSDVENAPRPKRFLGGRSPGHAPSIQR
jgi:hypothetical protein